MRREKGKSNGKSTGMWEAEWGQILVAQGLEPDDFDIQTAE